MVRMTARTKAAKRAAKRGPKRLSVDRQPNGQPSRSKLALDKRREETERDIMDTAIRRRIRHLGLVDRRVPGGKLQTAEMQAQDPRCGYALGLEFIEGSVNRGQHDFGNQYAEDMARYYGLTGTPFPSARAQDLFAVRGEASETESRAEAAAAATKLRSKLRNVLLSVGDIDTGRRVYSTVMKVCVQDIPPRPGERIWLRKGLNALGDFYRGRSPTFVET